MVPSIHNDPRGPPFGKHSFRSSTHTPPLTPFDPPLTLLLSLLSILHSHSTSHSFRSSTHTPPLTPFDPPLTLLLSLLSILHSHTPPLTPFDPPLTLLLSLLSILHSHSTSLLSILHSHSSSHSFRSSTHTPPLLQGGNLSDALVDLTGGVSAHLDLTLGGYIDDFEKRKQLFKMMRKEMDEHALMCCAISVGIELSSGVLVRVLALQRSVSSEMVVRS